MFSINRKETKRRKLIRQAVESLESRVLLSYALDPSFDSDGIAFGAGSGAFVVQPDNKIVAPTNGNHALRRYNVDGSIDTTFNGANNGTVSPISIQQLKLSGDKFVIADGGNVAQLNANGTLDTTFGGGDSVVQVPFGIKEMLIAPGGKIVLLGDRSVMNEDLMQYDYHFIDVARLNANGSWDTSFAGDGLIEWQESQTVSAQMIGGGVQSDGKIIAASSRVYSVMDGIEAFTYRFNADGTDDSTFNGYFDSPYSILSDLEVAPDNSYLLVNNARILHFAADGSGDPGFNQNGLNLSDSYGSAKEGSAITGIAPLAAGKILVTGYFTDNAGGGRSFVARLLADGNPDPSFSGTPDGMILLNQQANIYPADGLMDSAGRVILGGATYAGGGGVENNNWIARLKDPATAQHRYNGAPFNVGQTIQAEDFDTGGEGVAYHDTDANTTGAYRPTESVDIEPTTDIGGGYDVGYTAQSEWLEYTFNIPQSGVYSIDTRVASGLAGGLFHYEVDGQNRTGSIAIPNTGGWQNWTTISSNLGTLTAGNHTLRLAFDPSSNAGGQGNFNWLKINSGATPIGNGLRAEYFNNENFTGLGIIRNDAKVDFNWGSGSPDPAIGSDTFSVRWTAQLRAPATGLYTFFTTSDDGARLSINNQTIIDHLLPQGATEWSGTINLVAGQTYELKMEYFDRYGGALAKLQWAGPGIAKQVVPSSVLFSPSNTGDFEPPSQAPNFQATSSDTTIQATWGAASDNVGIGGYLVALDNGDRIRLSADARSYTFTGLQPDKQYNPLVWAIDLAGNQGPGNGMFINTQKATDTTVNGLRGEYFNNPDFTAPVFTRTDANVNFNWGSGSPDSRVGADTFSVRWTGKLNVPTTGRYTFYTTTDDGGRLWVNNQLLIDKFVPQAATEWSGSIDLVGGQKYDIKMEYFDRYGGAQAVLSWAGPGITKQVIPASQFGSSTSSADTQPPSAISGYSATRAMSNEIDVQWNSATDNVGVAGYELRVNDGAPTSVSAGLRSFAFKNLQPSTSYRLSINAFDAAGNRGPINTITATTTAATAPSNGLKGEYFNNMDLTAPIFTRTDGNVNFDWGTGSPGAGVDADTFSVRWTGHITAPTTGRYTFFTTSDDGARLTINGQKIIDKFVPQAATEWSGVIDLVAGQSYSFNMEYFDRFGGALAKVQWAGPGISKTVVPQSAFVPT